MTTRYEYSSHSTRQKAEDALEHYYADGDVSECEHPIVHRRGLKTSTGETRWVVTLEDWAA